MNAIQEIQEKTIIIHLPIDLTTMQNYKDPQENNPQSYNLQESNRFNKSFVENNNLKQYLFVNSKGKKFKCINTELISNKYYEKEKDDVCSIHCWHCFCKILGKPIGLPIKYENSRFHIKGFFCSFNCMLTFNYYSLEFDNIIQERESLIRMLHKKTAPGDATPTYAPIREVLKIFGGTLSYDEFHTTKSDIQMIYYPVVPIVCYIEENCPVEIEKNENKQGLYSFCHNSL